MAPTRERHPLTFAQLRAANLERDRYAFGHALPDWSASDWGAAAAGELGEALNLITHARRGEPVERAAIAAELADAVVYLDLLAAKLGIDLGRAVAWKFNTTSQRRGASDRLQPAPETPADPGCVLPADEVDDAPAVEDRRAAAAMKRAGRRGLPPGHRIRVSDEQRYNHMLAAGSLVRVVIEVAHANGVTDRESVWLRVVGPRDYAGLDYSAEAIAAAGAPREYEGTLQTSMQCTTLLDYGSRIVFEPRHVEFLKPAPSTPPRAA